MRVRAKQLHPLVDLSGGEQLADRQGVFAQSFRCMKCTMHFRALLLVADPTHARHDHVPGVRPPRTVRALPHGGEPLGAPPGGRRPGSRDCNVWPFRSRLA